MSKCRLIMHIHEPMLWLATCPHETVQVLASELQSLGVKEQTHEHRGILFKCNLRTAYRAHLKLRAASRVQRIVAMFKSPDLKTFQKEVNAIAWPEWLRLHRSFTVKPSLADSSAQKLGEVAVTQALANAIKSASFLKNPPPYSPGAKSDEAVMIVPYIKGAACALGIDTSGRALHKRGWRTQGHPAVLKETLAASMLMLTGYNGEEPLLDPMCGSGTIVIEAAYIALNKAPLIHRGKDDFTLEHLVGFDRKLWREVTDELRAQKRPAPPAPLYASDIRSEYIEIAKKGALRARVEKHIQFRVSSFRDLKPPANRGLLIANLPYGERIGSGTIERLYRDVGEKIQKDFSQWRVALLVPRDTPIDHLRLRAPNVISLRNGALPVKLVISD